jgi:hypothetical protein
MSAKIALLWAGGWGNRVTDHAVKFRPADATWIWRCLLWLSYEVIAANVDRGPYLLSQSRCYCRLTDSVKAFHSHKTGRSQTAPYLSGSSVGAPYGHDLSHSNSVNRRPNLSPDCSAPQAVDSFMRLF